MRIIPEDLNKKIKREYRLRFLNVFLIMISVVVLITTALVSSSYLLLYLYQKAYVKEGVLIGGEADNLQKEVETKTRGLFGVVKKIKEDDMSTIIVTEKIFAHARTFVTIQSLEILADNKVTLRVFAPNRNSLLAFEKNMKQDAYFEGFVVPVEALARQENINFSVTFTYDKN